MAQRPHEVSPARGQIARFALLIALVCACAAITSSAGAAPGTAARSGAAARPVRVRSRHAVRPVHNRSARSVRSGHAAPPASGSHAAPSGRSTPGSSNPSAHMANGFGQQMFGIASDGLLQDERPVMMQRDVAFDAGTGARWLRIDINWAQIQGANRRGYYWRGIDRVVKAARAHKLSVLGVLIYTPSWAAAKHSCHQPDCAPNTGDFARFASAAVQHYAPLGVNAYEVWSEENSTAQWLPKPDPAAYVSLLKAAYPAIKHADPKATVITGGTSPSVTNGTDYSPPDYLAALYADGAKGYFDAVGAHPYCWPAYPGQPESWSPWYQMFGAPKSMRSVMVANGDGGKLIWGTEFGAATDGPKGSYVSPATQAKMIYDGYALWRTYHWAGPLFLYDGRDHLMPSHTQTMWNYLGLGYNNFHKKPSYSAYQRAVKQF